MRMDDGFSGKIVAVLSALMFISVLFLWGCGSSQGDDDALDCPGDPGCPETKEIDLGPSLSDFLGTYDLQGFRILDETGSVNIDETDVDSYCGRMVITSDSVILYDQTLEGNAGHYRWEILAITKNAFLIREGACEAWVDYLLAGNDFILIWPEGPCMEDYTLTLRTFKTSTSETYLADSCPLPETSPVELDPQLQKFVGNYELIEFGFTDTQDGTIMTPEDAETWSGNMVMTDEGAIDFSLLINGQEFRSVWEILEVDEARNQLLLSDRQACEERIDFQSDDQGELLTLTWSGSGCTSPTAMTFQFAKSDEAAASLSALTRQTAVAQFFDGDILGMESDVAALLDVAGAL